MAKLHANNGNAWPICGAKGGLVLVDPKLGGPPAKQTPSQVDCDACKRILKKRLSDL
jgi:hypothetical protein